MKQLKPTLKEKLLPSFKLLAVGVSIVILAFMFGLDAVVGANIGAGFIYLIGMAVSFFAVISIAAITLSTVKLVVVRVGMWLVLIGIAASIFGLITRPISNYDEINKIHNCGPIEERTGRPDKYCGNLKQAPEAELDYANSAVLIGLTTVLVGATVANLGLRSKRTRGS